MKKSTVVVILCVLVLVPMLLLTTSIRENKAEQQAISAVPAVKDGETRASEWGKLYPRQYDTYMQTRKSDKIDDVLKEDPARAAEVLTLLSYNEGNNSGRGIGCISWDGKVHPDQFWRHHVFGNVRQRPFSEIWDDPNIELLAKLKDKKKYVKGRCATCRYLSICGGNFRARAEAVYDDVWAPDPACYLTDDEIRAED